jgi:hypothetical protein
MQITYKDIPYDSPQWHAFRKNASLGASEIPTCLSLNPYESKLELFHRKIGLLNPKKKSLPMMLGNMSENLIAELYSYYVEDESKFLENISNKTPVRKVELVGGICQNSLYENLFVSMDRKCFENGEWINLEFKNKSMNNYRTYVNEINPMEASQLACQLIVSRFSKARIIYLIENRVLKVFEMDLETAMMLEPTIVKESNDFCKRVEKAKILISQIYNAKSNYSMKLAESLEQELYKLEPSGSGQAYLDYLTELSKEKKASVGMKGNEQLLKVATDLKKLSEKKKKLIEQETKLKSELASAMRLENKVEIDFGKCGSVSLFNGRFNNKVK